MRLAPFHVGLFGAAALLCACAPTGVSDSAARTNEPAPEGPEFDVFEAVAELSMPQWEDEPPMPDSAGIGTLEVRGSTDLSRQLDLASLTVDAKVTGHVAAFEVEHVFDNPTDEILEGTFRFPLPDGAVVTGLAMEIDGRMMEGEVLDREKAREIYQSIVDSMQDPALLEWEQGQTFKLRVFPIEAQSTKRVVLRYLAPLHRAKEPTGDRWELVVPTSAPTLQGSIGRLTIRVDEQTVVDRHDAKPVGATRVDIASAPGSVLQQSDEHGTFTAVRLQPDWASIPEPNREDAPRRLLVVVDTSRSALESWGLTREALRIVLESLSPEDEICVVASDLTARAHAPGFLPASEDEIAAAMAFIDDIEPDGASDLSAALAEIDRVLTGAEESMTTQVVVLGDGVPTWGETDRAALVQQAEGVLHGVPLHGLVLGRKASSELLGEIAGVSGGRIARPESSSEVEWFAGFLDVAPRLKRIRGASVQADGDHELAGLSARTIFEGQTPTAYVRTPVGAEPPIAVTLLGTSEARPVEQAIAIEHAAPSAGLRKLWASHRINKLQADKGNRADVIAMSETHGVLSRYTAFLVLESEEAYREHAIERRRAAEQADPSVTGADLGEGGGETSLRPGDIQPGDPEILIPAPQDARRVVVVFPFGETKIARWDDAAGKWIVRFLIDEDTAPGRYEVAVRVTMPDGTLRRMTAEYTVDVRAPSMEVRVVALDDGSFEVHAEQSTTEADRERERLDGVDAELPERASFKGIDARKVEARLPDGQVVTLHRERMGQFVGRWQPSEEVGNAIEVELVSTDRALNSSRSTHAVTVEAG